MAMPTTPAQSQDSGSFGWAVLGFFIPIVGLILWLVWRDTRPRDARMSRNGFIAGLIVGVVVSIIYAVAMAALLGSIAAAQ